jgi:hypothetical protein
MFSPSNPRLQVVWDATSLTAFSRCPRAYQYRHIDLWTTKQTTDHLVFGQLFHRALELHYKRPSTIENLISSVTAEETFHFLPTDFSVYSRFALIRAIVWYFEHYSNDPLQVFIVNGTPAVELNFTFPTGFHSQYNDEYILAGHLDMVATMGDSLYVVDHKTTKSTLSQYYFERYTPDIQMSLYTLASHIIFGIPAQGVLINGIQTLVNGTAFLRGFANRTQEQLDEFFDIAISIIKNAEQCAVSGDFPMNQASCFGCRFREVCSKSPSMRESFLNADFVKTARWDPSIPR